MVSIYRHPHNNFDEFYKYFEMCLGSLAKENKEVYICGDFNLDLLKIDILTLTQMSMIHFKTSEVLIKLKNKLWLSPEILKMSTLRNKVFARN